MADFKKILKSVARESAQYIIDQAKRTYPAIKAYKNNVCGKINEVACKDCPNAASQMFNDVSELVSKKSRELSKAKKAVAKERKRSKKQIIKYSLIAGGSGLIIGAGAGYLVSKNNQIIQSDYIYNDSFVPNPPQQTTQIAPKEVRCYPKSFEPYKNGYFISSDGTTIIKKANN